MRKVNVQFKLDEGRWNSIQKEIVGEFRENSEKLVRDRGNVFLRQVLNLMKTPASGVLFSIKFELFVEKFLKFLETGKHELLKDYPMDKKYRDTLLKDSKETRQAIQIIGPIVRRHFPQILELEKDFFDSFLDGMKRLGLSRSRTGAMKILKQLSGTPFFRMQSSGFVPPLGIKRIEVKYLENDVKLNMLEVFPTLPDEIKFHERNKQYYDHGELSTYKLDSPVFIAFSETGNTVFLNYVERNKIITGVSPDFRNAFSSRELKTLAELEDYLQARTTTDRWVYNRLQNLGMFRLHDTPRNLIPRKYLRRGYITKRINQVIDGRKDREAGLNVERFFYIDHLVSWVALVTIAKRMENELVEDDGFAMRWDYHQDALLKARSLLAKVECMRGYSLSLFFPIIALFLSKKKLIIPIPESFYDMDTIRPFNAEAIKRDIGEYKLMRRLYEGKKKKCKTYVEGDTAHGFQFPKDDFTNEFRKLTVKDYKAALKRLREADVYDLKDMDKENLRDLDTIWMWTLRMTLHEDLAITYQWNLS